jgi:hypothetical protein
VNTGLPDTVQINAIATTGNFVYLGTSSQGVWVSYNNGANWLPLNIGFSVTPVLSLLLSNDGLYAGTYTGVWYLSLTNFQTCSAHFALYPDAVTPHLWYALTTTVGLPAPNFAWNWGDGSSPSYGDTATHTYSAPGYYTICLTVSDSTGCSNTFCDSSTYIFKTDNSIITIDAVSQLPADTTGTGIQNLQAKNTISITTYPNPFTDQTHFTITGLNQKYDLELYDLTGRLQTRMANLQTKQFDLQRNNLSAGVYLYRIITNGEPVGMGKLVIE